MRKLGIPLVLVLLLLSGSLVTIKAVEPSSDGSNALKQGKYWLNRRTVNSDSYFVNHQNIDRAIDFFEEALTDSRTRKNAAELLIKAYYIKGTFSDLSLRRKQEIFGKGKKLGERMVKEFPNSLRIKFGYLGNLGRWSETHGVFAAAMEGVVGTMRSVAQDIIRLDPHFDGAAGYRIMGYIHERTPYIPIVTGWASNEKAVELVKKAHSMYPEHPGNNYYLGKLLLERGRLEEAKPYLKKVLEITPRDHWVLRDRRFQHLARDMLQEIERKTGTGN